MWKNQHISIYQQLGKDCYSTANDVWGGFMFMFMFMSATATPAGSSTSDLITTVAVTV